MYVNSHNELKHLPSATEQELLGNGGDTSTSVAQPPAEGQEIGVPNESSEGHPLSGPDTFR